MSSSSATSKFLSPHVASSSRELQRTDHHRLGGTGRRHSHRTGRRHPATTTFSFSAPLIGSDTAEEALHHLADGRSARSPADHPAITRPSPSEESAIRRVRKVPPALDLSGSATTHQRTSPKRCGGCRRRRRHISPPPPPERAGHRASDIALRPSAWIAARRVPHGHAASSPLMAAQRCLLWASV
jgi:hypothetical protein